MPGPVITVVPDDTVVPDTTVVPVVAVVMGSDSDWNVMSAASAVLSEFGVEHEVEVVSAHRTPEHMIEFGKLAAGRGIRVIIAGAGGAAHLPGMLASVTTLPVIGVPVPLSRLDGLDSLLSIVQMPAGVPVATVSIGGARNAGLLAIRMLAITDSDLTARLAQHATTLAELVATKNDALQASIARGSSVAGRSQPERAAGTARVRDTGTESQPTP